MHYLETISPQPLLAQLLSALLGLSVFVLEEACSAGDSLPATQVRRRKPVALVRRILTTECVPLSLEHPGDNNSRG